MTPNPDEPLITEQCVKLLTAILLRAIKDAKAAKSEAARWLASEHARQMAESVGVDSVLWRDVWGEPREEPREESREEPKRKQRPTFTNSQLLIIEQVACGYTQAQAAATVGIHGRTVYAWKQRNKAFREAVGAAKQAWKEKRKEGKWERSKVS